MKKLFIYSLALLPILYGCGQGENKEGSAHDHHEYVEEITEEDLNSPKSIPREVHGQVGTNHVTIKYHSPGVRGRTIWGGLVAYNQVWVAGAHQATSVEFSIPIEVEGQQIPKGKYAFFAVPGKETWHLILNKNWEQHLTDEYAEEDDLVRIEVTPNQVSTVERLEYEIIDAQGEAGEIVMRWDTLEVKLPFTNK
ncbi:DUF2911 domain-containing protein [Litoribacter alkaliphilus]|uniref:DUF2911 domain-containing protein n=1 Tax=Litoribacter ruber TaxID=702568 RepID=A0AAP2G3J3_9BACT|nr:DUF2911 domain-containing protein [Litoribacter alkaliphilus]MBS9523071.1 DUF2911 domain-containing protein [Litoribacter alkaliphilus]